MIQVGSHVVCLFDFESSPRIKGRPDFFLVKWPKKGIVYTVREIRDGGILLDEIVNSPRDYLEMYCEVGFAKKAFKPLKKLSVGDLVSEEVAKEITESA